MDGADERASKLGGKSHHGEAKEQRRFRQFTIIVQFNGLMMTICALGVELSFQCYSDSTYLPGPTAAVEKYIFIVSVCAAFTHDRLTPSAGLCKDSAALQSDWSEQGKTR